VTESLIAASELVGLPDGCFAEAGITIVGFIDPEGDEMFAFATHGSTRRSSMVGLLSMVQAAIMGDDSFLE